MTCGSAATVSWKRLVARVLVPGERDQHVDLQREAGRAAVEPRGDAAQDARLLEPPDAVQRRGRREPDEPRELHVGAVGVALQLVQQPDVDFVERKGH